MNSLVVRATARALLELLGGRRVRRAGLLHDRALALILAPPRAPDALVDKRDAARGAPEMLVFALEPGAPHLRLEDARALDRRRTAQLGEVPAKLAGSTIHAVEAIGLERILAVTLIPSTSFSTAGSLVITFELLARTPFLVVTEEGNVLAAVRAPGTRRPDARDMARGATYQLPFDLGPPGLLPAAGALLDARLAAATTSTPEGWAEALGGALHGVSPGVLAALTAGAQSAAEVRDRVLGAGGPLDFDPGPPPSLELSIAPRTGAPDPEWAHAALAALAEYGAVATAALAASAV